MIVEDVFNRFELFCVSHASNEFKYLTDCKSLWRHININYSLLIKPFENSVPCKNKTQHSGRFIQKSKNPTSVWKIWNKNFVEEMVHYGSFT